MQAYFRNSGGGLMDVNRRRAIINIIIVIAIIVIFTVYKMQSPTDVATIGVDDEKVGISYDEKATFIMLEDIQEVKYIESLDTLVGDYIFAGSLDVDAYIWIKTDTEIYVINGASITQTKKAYEDIQAKL